MKEERKPSMAGFECLVLGRAWFRLADNLFWPG
jgi:hypothetical protein